MSSVRMETTGGWTLVCECVLISFCLNLVACYVLVLFI